nr:hypothetical protein [Tanacetum cinerariifolium]
MMATRELFRIDEYHHFIIGRINAACKNAIAAIQDNVTVRRIEEIDATGGGGGSPCSIEDEQLLGSPSLTPVTMVAKLIDGYLAEVAPDVNLKLGKFMSLAEAVPEIIVQVLFFEQLQLRTSIAGCFLVSDNLDGSRQLRSGLGASQEGGWNTAVRENQVLKVGMDSMRMRVSELEKECSNMKQEIEK